MDIIEKNVDPMPETTPENIHIKIENTRELAALRWAINTALHRDNLKKMYDSHFEPYDLDEEEFNTKVVNAKREILSELATALNVVGNPEGRLGWGRD